MLFCYKKKPVIDHHIDIDFRRPSASIESTAYARGTTGVVTSLIQYSSGAPIIIYIDFIGRMKVSDTMID